MIKASCTCTHILNASVSSFVQLGYDYNYTHEQYYSTVIVALCNLTAVKQLTLKLSSDFSTFYRTNKASFDHFTNEQKVLVNNVIHSISKHLKDAFGTSHNITEYVSE